MADLPNRDTHEAALAAAVSKELAKALTVIMRELGNPARYENIPASIWNDLSIALSGAMLQPLIDAYMAAGQAELDSVGGGVDWAKFSNSAADWASQYSLMLAVDMIATTQTAVQKAIRDYIARNLTITQLRERLTPAFGAVRADGVAITEITRAATEGKSAIAALLRLLGMSLTEFIRTYEDERVCAICEPKNGKPVSQEGRPPFHIRCRCDVDLIPGV